MVFVCGVCCPNFGVDGKALGVASIDQPGREEQGTLRIFSWKGEEPYMRWPWKNGVDAEWLLAKGFIKEWGWE